MMHQKIYGRIVLAFVTIAFIEGDRRVFQNVSYPYINVSPHPTPLQFLSNFDTTKILMIKCLEEYFFMKLHSQ